MKTTPIIRKRNGKRFRLMDAQVLEVFGVLVKDSYWIECNENGQVSDGDSDGKIDHHTIRCRIPKGHSDIDLSTLSENCLE